MGKTKLFDTYSLGILHFRRVHKTEAVDIHIKKLFCDRGLLLSQFYDISGDYERKESLQGIVKILISREKNHLGDFPIHGIFLVYDVNNRHSFAGLGRWVKFARQAIIRAAKEMNPALCPWIDGLTVHLDNLPLFFVGNKLDKLKDRLETKLDDIRPQMKRMDDYNRIIEGYAQRIITRFRLREEQYQNIVFTSVQEDMAELDDIIIRVYKEYMQPTSPGFMRSPSISMAKMGSFREEDSGEEGGDQSPLNQSMDAADKHPHKKPHKPTNKVITPSSEDKEWEEMILNLPMDEYEEE